MKCQETKMVPSFLKGLPELTQVKGGTYTKLDLQVCLAEV